MISYRYTGSTTRIRLTMPPDGSMVLAMLILAQARILMAVSVLIGASTVFRRPSSSAKTATSPTSIPGCSQGKSSMGRFSHLSGGFASNDTAAIFSRLSDRSHPGCGVRSNRATIIDGRARDDKDVRYAPGAKAGGGDQLFG